MSVAAGWATIDGVSDVQTFEPPSAPATPAPDTPLALTPAQRADRALFWLLALPLLLADQLTKQWVLNTIPLNTSIVPLPALDPYLAFTYVANNGTVFGLFQQGEVIFATLAALVGIGLMIVNWRLPWRVRKLRVGLALVLAGAVGNLIDRLRVGHVIDFVDIDLTSIIPLRIADWYIFNIADASIVTAICLLLYLMWFEPTQIEPGLHAAGGTADAAPPVETGHE